MALGMAGCPQCAGLEQEAKAKQSRQNGGAPGADLAVMRDTDTWLLPEENSEVKELVRVAGMARECILGWSDAMARQGGFRNTVLLMRLMAIKLDDAITAVEKMRYHG